MSIKVDTYQMQSKAAYASTLSNQLETAARQLNNLYYGLDAQVKSRRGIGITIRNLEQRIEKSQQKMYNISKYLTKAAADYNATEALVVAKSARLGAVGAITATGNSMAQIGTGSGAAGGKIESKKWYQSNWLKIAVGTVVVGAAVTAAIFVGGPILAAAAVGAVVGGGIGGITSGISSAKNGGKFIDGFADGFMWGALGGAITGAIGATGIGIAGGALAEGAVNTGIYIGQTLQNDGKITITGLATSFVVAAGFSAVGGLASKKITKIVQQRAIKKQVLANIDKSKAARAASKFSEYLDSEKALMKGLKESDEIVEITAKGTGNYRTIAQDRLNSIRNQMPNNDLAKRGNMAMADVKIEGMKSEFSAHSKIDSISDKGADIADFSLKKPETERIFETYEPAASKIDGKPFDRFHDTEAKILEDIASQVKDTKVFGTIDLYTELPACQSCTNIVFEFRRKFPNIKLNVYTK